jgi:hypothetical protein
VSGVAPHEGDPINLHQMIFRERRARTWPLLAREKVAVIGWKGDLAHTGYAEMMVN